MRISHIIFSATVFSLFFAPATCFAHHNSGNDAPHVQLLDEFRPIGGGGNNLDHPNYDPVPGTNELAIAPLNFSTGGGLTDGPNPRTISNVIAGGSGANGQNAETTDPVASAWVYVFGQFIDHDLDLEYNTPSTAAINIVVPPGDPVFAAGSVIQMNRDVRSPTTNTIINTTAGYLDLSQLYGSTTDVAASLRNSDGTLKTTYNGQGLPIVGGSFVTGDPRVTENPELTALTMLFMREHNYWAAKLLNQHPDWNGDQIYNMAKAINTAEYQNIVYNEYVPLLLGNVLGPYRGYDSRYSAQITQEFSTAAFRMGHSQVSDTQEGDDNQGNEVFTESLADSFFNTPDEDMSNGIDPLLRSLSNDGAQATDVYSVAALRNLLFAGLVGGDVDEMDLIAIDIQRERDVGLGTLNQTRQALGLMPYRSFSELTRDPILQRNLEKVYGRVGNVDLFIGGLAEQHVPGALLGPTFQMIIAQQFHALRSSDRFFWQNENFDPQTANMIAQTTLANLLERDAGATGLQDNVFIQVPTGHIKRHVMHVHIETHGRRGRPFLRDGW